MDGLVAFAALGVSRCLLKPVNIRCDGMFLLQLEQGGDSTARPGEDQDPGLGPSAGHSLLAAVLQSWQLSDLDALGFDMCGIGTRFCGVSIGVCLAAMAVCTGR